MTPKPDQAPRTPTRRPYATPTLVVYGDAVTLTQSRTLIGKKNDGSGKLKMRTQ